MSLDPVTAGIDLVKTFVGKFVKDKDLATKLNAAAESEEFQGEVGLQMAQINVNMVEAAHPSIWVSGWRPAVGWICALGVLMKFIIMPPAIFIAVVIYKFPEASLPDFDIFELLGLLGGILGLGTIRMNEKIKGVARN